MNNTINAACVLIIDPNNPNQILAVARKNAPNEFGLPGGKVDGNESLMDAAIRETKEETGLDIELTELLYSDLDSNNVRCTTFLAVIIGDNVLKPREGEPEAKWGSWKLLFNGPFSNYNKNVYAEYYKRK